MLKQLKFCAAFLAWLLATGVQWDVLQVVAWGNMFLDNMATRTMGAALEKTFDGEECELCVAVREAKQREESPGVPSTKQPQKITLIFSAKAVYIHPPAVPKIWELVDAFCTGEARSAPPVPPPRLVWSA